MEFTARQIADFLQGEIVGDPDARVSNVSKIEEGKPGTLSFLANPKYEKYLYESKSTIILINEDFDLKKEVPATLIRVKNAYDSFASLMQLYEQSIPKESGISSLSSIDPSASLGENLYVGDFTVISKNCRIGNNVRLYPQVYVGKNVSIGNNTIIYPGVKIYHDCVIGSGCIFHSGTVIGSDGFGFAGQDGSAARKIPQLGNVIIEDDVELGSNVSVDRATMGSTLIRKGVKMDNLIQIAHNVEVGENSIIVAQSGIAGSAKIGKRCIIAAQVGINGHISIADDVKIGAKAAISNSLKEPGEAYLGIPGNKAGLQKRIFAVTKRLPEMYQTINQLERELEILKKKLA